MRLYSSYFSIDKYPIPPIKYFNIKLKCIFLYNNKNLQRDRIWSNFLGSAQFFRMGTKYKIKLLYI